MNILITGGTGFIGRRLAIALSKKHAVTVFDRCADPELGKAGVRCVAGDILCDSDLKKIKAPDIIYHLAAILDESNPILWKVNVDGTRNLLRIFPNVRRFIFTSPIGVLGGTKKPAAEDAKYNPRTKYERSKVAAERAVIESGAPYTIVRMTIIIGPNDFWKQIFTAAKKKYPIIGTGKNYWHLLYIDDAVQALILAAKPAAQNKIYNIASADPYTYLETYAAIASALKIEIPKKHIPVFLAKLAAAIHELQCKITGRRPDVTKMGASIDRLIGNRIVDISKARRELSFKPKFNLDCSIRETLKALGEF